MRASLELPGGRIDEAGAMVQTAELRRLSGEDEAWLASLDATLPTAYVVTGLLARCTTRLGDRPEPGAHGIRQLLVGDRDYLLLELRRLSRGPHFNGLLDCGACGATMDLSFEADDVPIQRQERIESSYRIELERRDGRRAEVVYRLPTGADQEAVAGSSMNDPGRALLARCVEAIDGRAIGPEGLDALASSSLDQLDESIQRLSPNLELSMRITCPNCGLQFDADYDLLPFLMEEMRRSAAQLQREVHSLAFYYHWPLKDILALTAEERRGYVSLIIDEKLSEAQR